jgi:hypothetical protein
MKSSQYLQGLPSSYLVKRQNVIEKVKIVQPLKNANLVTRYLSAAKMMIVQNGITYDHIT